MWLQGAHLDRTRVSLFDVHKDTLPSVGAQAPTMLMPPSTRRVVPVMNLAPGVHRNATASAMSSGVA